MPPKEASSGTYTPSQLSLAKKKYQVIYPQYIDSTLTPSTGRKINLAHAVAEPTIEEMMNALKALGFTAFFDPSKSLAVSQCGEVYPPLRGCIRVAIKAPSDEHYIKKSDFDTQTRGTCVEGYTTKGQVLRKLAETIAAIPGRPVPPPPPVTKGLKAAAMKEQQKQQKQQQHQSSKKK